MCVIALPKGSLDSILGRPAVPAVSPGIAVLTQYPALNQGVVASPPTKIAAKGTGQSGGAATEVKITDVAKLAMDATKERVDMLKESHDKLFSLIAAFGALLVFFGFKGLETFNATRKRAEETVEQAAEAVREAEEARQLAEKSVKELQNFVENRYTKDNTAEINVSQGIVLREMADLYNVILERIEKGENGNNPDTDKHFCSYLRSSLVYLDSVTDNPEGLDKKIVSRAFIAKGNVFSMLNELPSALKMAEMVITKHNPADHSALYNGACYSCRLAARAVESDDHQAAVEYESKAISYLRRALELNPDYSAEAKADKDFKHFATKSNFLALVDS